MYGYVSITVTEYAREKIICTWKEVVEWKLKPLDEKLKIRSKYWLGFIPVIAQIEEVLIPEHLKPYFKIYYYDEDHCGAYQSMLGDQLQALYDLVSLSNEILIDDTLARFYRTFLDGVFSKEF